MLVPRWREIANAQQAENAALGGSAGQAQGMNTNSTYGGLKANISSQFNETISNIQAQQAAYDQQVAANLETAAAQTQALLVPVNQCLANFNAVQSGFTSIDQQAVQQPVAPAFVALPASASVPAPTPNPTKSFLINNNVGFSQSGQDVVALQKFLESKNFLSLPTGTADGHFGNLTKQALMAFQKSAGLPATGFCGSMTRSIINGQQ